MWVWLVLWCKQLCPMAILILAYVCESYMRPQAQALLSIYCIIYSWNRSETLVEAYSGELQIPIGEDIERDNVTLRGFRVRQRGAPKKNRDRSRAEPGGGRTARAPRRFTCSNCGGIGHSERTCVKERKTMFSGPA
jgi:hypothetical protein